jgi:hypothetical protein
MAKDILIDDYGDLVIENGTLRSGTVMFNTPFYLSTRSWGPGNSFPLLALAYFNTQHPPGQTAQLKRNILEQMQPMDL